MQINPKNDLYLIKKQPQPIISDVNVLHKEA